MSRGWYVVRGWTGPNKDYTGLVVLPCLVTLMCCRGEGSPRLVDDVDLRIGHDSRP